MKTEPERNASQAVDIQGLEVQRRLDCGEVVVTLYAVPVGNRCNRNIIGARPSGELLWQVEDVNPSQDSPFLRIEPLDKETMRAHNWIGVDYSIDLRTGALTLLHPSARPW